MTDEGLFQDRAFEAVKTAARPASAIERFSPA